TATDFDNRPAVGSLLSRMLGIEHANLLKILVSSNLIKSMNLLRRFEETKATNLLEEVTKSVKARCIDLKSVELEQFHLIPVENGEENAYRLVSQAFVDGALSGE
uniref:Uncharacterized protein n=1 Tax=Caenorhabditis japonica TaxID=281687 RepID=A0A8R1IY74_CAEJA